MNEENINLRDHFETLGATDATASPPPMTHLQAAATSRSRRRLARRSASLGVAAALLVGGLALAETPGGTNGEVTTEAAPADEAPAPTSPATTTPPTDSFTPSAPEADETRSTAPDSDRVVAAAENTGGSPELVEPEAASGTTPSPSLPEAPAPTTTIPQRIWPVGPVTADWTLLPKMLEHNPLLPSATSFTVAYEVPSRCWRPAEPVGENGGIEGIQRPFVSNGTFVVTETDDSVIVSGTYELPPLDVLNEPLEPGWFHCTYYLHHTVQLSSPLGDRVIYDRSEQEWPL